MAELVEWIGPCPLSPRERGFEGLVQAIVSQQLSTKVAHTIMSRVKTLCEPTLNPEIILALPDQDLRDVGLSFRKISYLKDLADKVSQKTLDLENLPNLSDEEVTQQLTSVKGIGKWTAEMYLIFDLCRPDVFSYGDFGLSKALCALYDLKKENYSDAAPTIVEKWRPYRSYACWYLWASLDKKKLPAAVKSS